MGTRFLMLAFSTSQLGDKTYERPLRNRGVPRTGGGGEAFRGLRNSPSCRALHNLDVGHRKSRNTEAVIQHPQGITGITARFRSLVLIPFFQFSQRPAEFLSADDSVDPAPKDAFHNWPPSSWAEDVGPPLPAIPLPRQKPPRPSPKSLKSLVKDSPPKSAEAPWAVVYG